MKTKINNLIIVDISYLNDIGLSCLTDNQIDVPSGNLNIIEIPISYVPFIRYTATSSLCA